MDLNIEDLNKIISAFVSNSCSDVLTEKCLKRLILYTSENDILLSHLSSILISAKNQANCLFKSLTALHYTINQGDQKFLHYLASNNLNFVNLDKHKQKFSNVNAEYLSFLKRYIKYLQQKVSVYKFINMESSWLTKLTQKPPKQQLNSTLVVKSDESVLQHDIIGEQLMRKISFIENQIDYLINEFNVDKLTMLFASDVLENNDTKTKSKIIEHVFSLLLNDVINYANYLQDIMRELIEQFELMNRKHCKDAIEVYRKLPDKIQHLRQFLMNCNRKLMEANAFQQIDLNKLIKPSIELQEKIEHHWKELESKPKRKNSERRKEKSKYAARVRRGEESELLNDLSELVPLPDVKSQDKASVMRLSIAFINTKQFVQSYFRLNNCTDESAVNKNDDLFNESDYLDVLKTSNLILALLSLDGDLVFISPNVINLIGLKQTEMLGMSIFDFVHPCDHDELKNSLKQISEATDSTAKKANDDDGSTLKFDSASSNEIQQYDSKNGQDLFKENKYVSFMVRIKCTLNNKSKCVPLKSANYKMASFSGYLKESKTTGRPLLVLSVDILLSPSAQLKCAGSSVFVTKHTPDLKFVNTDEKLTSLFGYDEKDLIGCSFFQYIHASDAAQLFNSFQKLLSKGEVETGYYRFLCKTGGYYWISTKASLLTDYSTQKPQTILCVHYLISELVYPGLVLSSKQSQLTKTDALNADENSTLVSASNVAKKAQRLTTKKAKPPTNKIAKSDLNSVKAVKKCNSSNKTNCRKSVQPVQPLAQQVSTTDELFVLKDSSNLREDNNVENSNVIAIDDKLVGLEESLCDGDLDHFVQDCKEFDCVLEKIKFKEQFKKEYEAELNSRMTMPTVEPLFNTFSVFSPLEEDQCVETEPSIDNSPLIATPLSIAYASKVDMTCMPWNELSNDDISCDMDLASTSSSPSSSSSSVLSPYGGLNESDSLFDSSTSDFTSSSSNSSYIPQIDELKTTMGNTNSIFTRLTDDSNTNNGYITYTGESDVATAKMLDFDENWINLAPQAGDSCIGLDLDELPSSLDAETEKLIKEMSYGNLSDTSSANSSSSINVEPVMRRVQIAHHHLTNSTINHQNPLNDTFDSSKFKNLTYDDDYVSSSKSVKIPNHFNSLDSEISSKKPRISNEISFHSSAATQPNKMTNSKLTSSSVLLNLLVNGQDLHNGYP